MTFAWGVFCGVMLTIVFFELEAEFAPDEDDDNFPQGGCDAKR